MAREEQEPEPYEGGAGGKFRKRPYRKPSTPYDRPSIASRDSSSGEGWRFSASRFIDKANGLFSRFRKRPPAETDPEMPELEAVQEATFEVPGDISNTLLRETKEYEGSSEGKKPRDGSDNQELPGDRVANDANGDGLVELEQLLKEKTFSRDEFDHLASVLRSRIVERFEGDRQTSGGNPSVVAVVETAELTREQRDLRARVDEKQEGPSENRVPQRFSSPIIPSAICDGLSPVDVAKAYMGAKTSTAGHGSHTPIFKDARLPSSSDAFASKISRVAPRSPICWPGAMAKEDCGYVTPQSSRIRSGLHNWALTPYPRTANPSSKTQHDLYLKHQHTPVFGGSQAPKRSNAVLDDGFPSIGSIHRIRQKSNLMTSRGTGSSHLLSPGFLQLEGSDVSKGFLPAKEDVGPDVSKSNLKIQATENKAKRFGVGSTSVPPHSTEMARKILEHIDRVVPSPKEKMEELKMAIAKDKSPPKSTLTGDKGKRPLQTQTETVQANIALGSSILAADTTSSMARTRYSLDFLKKNGFQTSIQEVSARLDHSKDNGKIQPSSHNTRTTKQDATEKFKVQTTMPSASESKEMKISSSSMKADGKHAGSSGNAAAFTFPVTPETSGFLCEPSPTPTLMPLHPKEGTSLPLYSFGATNGSSNGPVFSFTSAGSINASTPKFDFGSEKKAHFSFSLAVAASAAAQTMPAGTGSIKQGQARNSSWSWTASSSAMAISSPWPTSTLTSNLPGRLSSTSGNNNPSSFGGTFNFDGSSTSSGQTAGSSSSLASKTRSNLFGANHHPVMTGSGTSMPLVSATSTISGFGSSSSSGFSSTLSFDHGSPISFGQGVASISSLASTPTGNQSGANPFLKFGAGSSSVNSNFGTIFADSTQNTAADGISKMGSSPSGLPFSFGLIPKSSPVTSPSFGTGNKRSLDETTIAPVGGTSTSSSGAVSFGAPTGNSSGPAFLFTASSNQLGSFKFSALSSTPTTPASADVRFTTVSPAENSGSLFSVQSSPAGAVDTGGDKSGRRIIKINRDKRRR